MNTIQRAHICSPDYYNTNYHCKCAIEHSHMVLYGLYVKFYILLAL